jgi:hypothetical protein
MVGVGLRSASQGTDDAQWTADYAFARERLDIVVNALATRGVSARAISFRNVTLVSGTQSYSLEATVLDVLGDGAYAEPGEDPLETNGLTLVKQIPSHTFQRLAAKDSSGRPSLFYPDRTADTITVYFWPIPDEAGVVQLRTRRKLADTYDGAATLDLEESWDHYIIKAMEAELASAKTLPLALVQDKRAEAERLLEYAMGQGSEREDPRPVLRHASGWGRGRR